MDTTGYLDSVADNVELLVSAARQAGLDAAVPTCPGWKVADLTLHQGQVYLWIRELVRTQAKEYIPRKTLGEPQPGEDPLDWLKASADAALEVLRAADPEALVWNWLDQGPGPARFWYRRMAHETVIHRSDAEAAAGLESRVEPAELASDGIDEFLLVLEPKTKPQAAEALAGSFHFHTTDVAGEWVVVFGDGGVQVRREHAKADVAVRGPASELELFLYNRRGSDGLDVFGDPAMVAAWTEQIRF